MHPSTHQAFVPCLTVSATYPSPPPRNRFWPIIAYSACLLITALPSPTGAFQQPPARSCRCGPLDSCWPGQATWDRLNSTVRGQLIATEPLALPCYPGPRFNATQCAYITDNWTNATFQANSPVGLDYPIEPTCSLIGVTAGQHPADCTIGSSPRYAVNATSVDYVSAAVRFAREHNVRLVIKDTGHDILGRSTGYGSLEIWIRHLRTGLHFKANFESICEACDWSGPAFVVGGGYTWQDVYPLAQKHGVVVVGGGTPSVSVLGGWMQGGGHGPASRQYGLGADQLLSAQIVLANGRIITASACDNQDIYFAIRGGGPGTYGIVTEVIIKAHPMVDVQMQSLTITPVHPGDTQSLLDAVAIVYEAFPDLNDAGFAGYGTWSIASPAPLVGNSTSGYVHGIYLFNQTVTAAQYAFAPVLAKLKLYNGTLLAISVSYTTFPDYWTFFWNAAAVEGPVGTASALGSRLFSRCAIQKNPEGLRAMIQTLAGNPEEFTSNHVELVGGGAVFSDRADRLSGVNPAWRISHFSHIVARGWAPGSTRAVIESVQTDITYNKVAAMKRQAPDTGAYMNEADRRDPDFEQDFYGSHYERLRDIKARHDPSSVFYCPTCVDSAGWEENKLGVLCPAPITEFRTRGLARQ